jgi:hypothetical protein
MAGKKMEGNEEQRRKKAHQARRQGRSPSEQGGTTGASKQRRHLPKDDSHATKVLSIRQGKQPDLGSHAHNPEPRPGSGR